MTRDQHLEATIATYRKKPIEVQALRWTGDNSAALNEFTGGKFDAFTEPCDEDPDATASVLDSLHSTWVLCYTGDWIIRGIKGEFYPCRSEVFDATYEAVMPTREGTPTNHDVIGYVVNMGDGKPDLVFDPADVTIVRLAPAATHDHTTTEG